jgi:Protein of unknown function (DUF4238)
VSEDFSALDANQAKRHHFLPQLLLRRFAFERDGGDGIFQMGVTGRGAPRRVGLRGAASRKRFYSIPDGEGGLSNRHEGYLGLIERHAAPALDSLLADPGSLQPGDRATVAFFCAIQTGRTPAAAEQVTAVAGLALQNAVDEMVSDRTAFADRYRDFAEGDPSENDIEALREEIIESVREERLRVVAGPGGAIAEGLSHAIELVPAIIGFQWTLLRSRSGGFVTSDRGYAIHDPNPPVPWAAQGILSSDDSETAIPLGDDACLLLRPASMGTSLSVREVGPEEVEAINLQIYGWADRYVFGKTQAGLVALQALARRRPAAVDRPRPFCQAIMIRPDPEDDHLARANVARGWPAYVANDAGERRDYVVIEVGKGEGPRRREVERLAESRHRRWAASALG